MDLAALTSLIMGIITPFVPLIGTTVATKLSEDAYGKAKEQAKRLYEAIHKRFSHEKDGGNASQALTIAEEAKASRIRMSNSLGRGHQEITAGKSSIIDDVQFTIGNDKP